MNTFDQSVTKWLWIIVSTFLIALIITIWWLLSVIREFKSTADSFFSIAKEYEIVRKT